MTLFISKATKEEIVDFLKEIKGLTKEEAKNKFLTISEKELERVKDYDYFLLSNLLYLFIYEGGNVNTDIDSIVSDINKYISNQKPENDVLDKLIIKRRKVVDQYLHEMYSKQKISNFDSYGLSA